MNDDDASSLVAHRSNGKDRRTNDGRRSSDFSTTGRRTGKGLRLTRNLTRIRGKADSGRNAVTEIRDSNTMARMMLLFVVAESKKQITLLPVVLLVEQRF